MQTRKCGKTDLKLPVLGIGCFSFGGGSYWGEQSQKDVDAVVARALELGANFFDTAETYNDGASETSLGQALAGRRDRAIICTKLQPNHAYRQMVRQYCEASLKRLRTDYIDIYMLHWPLNPSALRHYTDDEKLLKNPPSIREALETMDELRREGKVRYLGISNFGVKQMQEALAIGVPLALNELAYSLIMRGIEFEALPYCVDHGLGILGYMPLSQGVLSDRYKSFDDLPPIRTRTRQFRGDRPGSRHGEPGFEAETMAAIEELRREAREAGTDLSDLALAWAISNPGISSVLMGARNLAQLEHNIKAAQFVVNPALRARLNAITDPLKSKLGPYIDYFQGAKNSRSW